MLVNSVKDHVQNTDMTSCCYPENLFHFHQHLRSFRQEIWTVTGHNPGIYLYAASPASQAGTRCFLKTTMVGGLGELEGGLSPLHHQPGGHTDPVGEVARH